MEEKKITPWPWRRDFGFNQMLSTLYGDNEIIMSNETIAKARISVERMTAVGR